MSLDPNIILGAKPVEIANPLDSAVKALTMSNLMQEHQGNAIKLNQQQREASDAQTMRDAYKNNTQMGPDGTPIVDRQGVMGDLMKANPMLAQKQAIDFRQTDLANQEQKMKMMSDQVNTRKMLMAQVPTDASASPEEKQAAWTNMIEQSNKLGLPNNDNHFTAQYPGDNQAMQMKMHLNTAEEQLAQQNKSQELQNKKSELEIERYKSFGGAPPSLGGSPTVAGGPAKGQAGAGKQPSVTDPAELVRYKVPPAQQPKVFDEIGAAQNTAQNAPKILKAFDSAAGKIHAVDFVPGMENVDQKALHALLGPTFKDVEGTVRQAAMDNMNKNVTPQFGDDKNTVDTKRSALVAYLKSKSSAPAAKGFGIDLTKFPSTFIPDDIGKAAKSAAPSKEQMMKLSRLQELRAKAAGGNVASGDQE